MLQSVVGFPFLADAAAAAAFPLVCQSLAICLRLPIFTGHAVA